MMQPFSDSNTSAPHAATHTEARRPARSAPLRTYLLSPRWSKVLGDIWENKLRAILVILSIALGTFAVGTIAEARIRMLDGLNGAYRAINPFTGAIGVVPEQTFDDDLVEAIRDIPGVKEAEGRAFADVRLRVGPGEWADLQLRAVPDWDDIRIGKFQIEQGTLPADREMLIERSALSEMLGTEIAIGDDLVIETLDQDRRAIRLVGSTYDLAAPPAFLFGYYTGYISVDTLEWLGESRDYTQLYFAVEDELLDDPEAIDAVATAVRDQVERSGREIALSFVPPNPAQSPIATFILDPLVFLLGALGVLMGFLSGFLVTNTVSGLLTQQTRQIGVLKAIGARRSQVAGLYLWLVTIFGLIAFVLAVPLAHIAAGQFAVFFGRFLNFDPATTGLLPEVLALQLFLSLGVPVLAALPPVLRGTRITIRLAIDGSGPGQYTSTRLDRVLQAVRGLPRPLLLSLRNTFRRKGRLALTLTTLTLAGAIFISVASVQASISRSLNTLFDTLVRYDVQVSFARSYRIARVEQVATQVPGVTAIESISSVQARRLRPDDSESEVITFQGLDLARTRIDPRIVAGRWLLPGDENAVVVSANLLNNEDDLDIGDEVILTVKGRELPWRIVGAFQGLGNTQIAYANSDYFARAVREVGETRQMQITIVETGDRTAQAQTARQLEERFRSLGIRVADTTTASAQRDLNERQFNVITLLLTIMALLIALVGGLGLAGTMSINVLERTREIGVMRAIGASDGTLVRLVLVEGALIGLLSWAIGGVLALPLSRLLSDQVGQLFTGAPLIYTFALDGVLIWLASALLLAAVASWLPAWNATRLTVREVLAYE